MVSSALGRSSPHTATVSSPVASPVASPAPALPDTPAGRQLAWVLDQINGDAATLQPAALTDRFSATFLSNVPADQIIAVLGQLAAAAPWTLVAYAEAPSGLQATGLIRSPSRDLPVSIAVEPVAPHRIDGLDFRAAVNPGTPVPLGSWQELDQRLAMLAPRINFLAAEVVDGDCRPIHGVHADRRLAIGSAFKLYVLGELARQVAAGEAAWDEELAIRDDLKSLPLGDMRYEPAGTSHTLRHFAEQMIQVSHNTATDHLIARLGHENVEAAQAAMGHDYPSVNVPFLMTRELFAFKLELPAERRDVYLAAGTEERRRILETEVAGVELELADAAAWVAPRDIDTIEWFASAADLCRAMAALQELSEQPGLEPITAILEGNPGLVLDAEMWPYVGFKSGVELGVLNLTWLLRRSDGRWFVATAGLNNPDAAIADIPAVLLTQAAIDLLAEVP